MRRSLCQCNTYDDDSWSICDRQLVAILDRTPHLPARLPSRQPGGGCLPSRSPPLSVPADWLGSPGTIVLSLRKLYKLCRFVSYFQISLEILGPFPSLCENSISWVGTFSTSNFIFTVAPWHQCSNIKAPFH